MAIILDSDRNEDDTGIVLDSDRRAGEGVVLDSAKRVGGNIVLDSQRPDGYKNEFEANDAAQSQSVFDSVRGGALALADGAAIGGGEALTATMQTIAERSLERGPETYDSFGGVYDFGGGVDTNREGFGTALLRNYSDNNDVKEKFTQENPGLSLALTIAGSIAPSSRMFQALSAPIKTGGVGLSATEAGMMQGVLEGGAFGYSENGMEGAVTWAGLAPLMQGTLMGTMLATKYGASLAAPRLLHGFDFVVDGVAGTRAGDIIKEGWARASEFTSPYLRTTQDAAKTLHKGIGNMMVKSDGIVLGRIQDLEHKNHKFAELVHEMDPDDARDFWMRLSTGNKRKAEAIAKRYRGAEGKAILNTAYETIKELGDEAKTFGYLMDEEALTKNYFPRAIKNYLGLKAHDLRKDPAEMLELDAWLMKARGGKGPRNEKHKAKLVAKYMTQGGSGRSSSKGQPGNMQERTRKKVWRDEQEFYEDPSSALNRYIHNMVDDLETRRFLGVNNKGQNRKDWAMKMMREEGEVDFDPKSLDDSVQHFITNQDMDGMTHRQVEQMRRILKARYGMGRVGMNKNVSKIRDFGTIASLGHFQSALTQFGDMAMAMHQSGGRNAMKAIFNVMRGRGITDLDMAGLDRTLMQELSQPGGWPTAVDGVLTAVGFKGIDKVGKRVLMDARVNEVGRMGSNEFQAKYGKLYGNETMKLYSSLRALAKTKLTRTLGKQKVFGQELPTVKLAKSDAAREAVENPNLRHFLFNTISDAQPVSPSQMPLKYLENPNTGRLMYQLKSYAVKQLNILYNDALEPLSRTADREEAIKQLISYVGYVGLVNGTVQEVKGLANGQGFNIEDIPDNAVWSLLQLAGLNKYNTHNATGPGDFIMSNITPPAISAGNAAWGIFDSAKGFEYTDGGFEGKDVEMSKQVGRIPIAGNAISVVDHLGLIDFDNIKPKKEN